MCENLAKKELLKLYANNRNYNELQKIATENNLLPEAEDLDISTAEFFRDALFFAIKNCNDSKISLFHEIILNYFFKLESRDMEYINIILCIYPFHFDSVLCELVEESLFVEKTEFEDFVFIGTFFDLSRSLPYAVDVFMESKYSLSIKEYFELSVKVLKYILKTSRKQIDNFEQFFNWIRPLFGKSQEIDSKIKNDIRNSISRINSGNRFAIDIVGYYTQLMKNNTDKFS